jgi:hypothetical protein
MNTGELSVVPSFVRGGRWRSAVKFGISVTFSPVIEAVPTLKFWNSLN